ncbi:hypothetical protein [Clostridium felsineum]|uniref:hypothetical protein n=1 Tax=Clostridium felsineum TaxID=36839 RepID=UPI00098C8261|nr:hypothetical protein [Clostridium felsineum]URZ01967.1 hypothetical protein CLAUR_019640 [Clostridium felsineum]
MSQKKNYSRSFIILQENEKGYGLSSDKLPTGYAKIEIKNGKCKISFYVQNLKKVSKPYNMLLVCNKKDTKKIINLGKINIDEYGRAEISKEFEESDVAGSKISIDKVIGASISQFIEDNIIVVMSGFNASDVSDSWKTYPLVQMNNESSKNKKEENKEKNTNSNERKSINNPQDLKRNIFDKYEEKIEKEKNENEEKPKDKEQKVDIKKNADEKPEVKEAVNIEEEVSKEETKVDEKNIEDQRNENESNEKNITEQKNENKSNEKNIEEQRNENDIHEKNIEEEKNENNIDEKNIEEKNEENLEEQISENEGDKEEFEDFPSGKVGEFFRGLTDGLEDLGEAFSDVKNCRWYKISSEYQQNMFDYQSYNRYTVIYYPMLMYYPYIQKYGHYLMGYKYDHKGDMKYIVYAVPGTRRRREQPFDGKTGFVSWIPLVNGEEEEDSLGYWLMFYDFKNSIIAVPKR